VFLRSGAPAEFAPSPESSPEGQREALILAYYEQMPLAEIARVMDIEVTLAVYAPRAEKNR
jgi:DNA-directed RNA polymerase specialized sigma24 family protein